MGAYYNRGNCKYKLSDRSGATLDFNKAIEIDPDSKEAYYNMEICKDELRDNYGAIQ